MDTRTVLVTGATGFVGRHLVEALCTKGYRVRAGVHRNEDRAPCVGSGRIDTHHLDVLDTASLMSALDGVDYVFHLAALVDGAKARQELYEVNVEGTRRVWECAARRKVQKALYCSSTAVYGLLARTQSPITESVKARAVEPYGHSKLLGEEAALEVSGRTSLHTTIIRPVAVFGPEEHTPFGRDLRDAAVSKVLLAGGFQNKRFSFVHVDDVAEAAIHLMERDGKSGEIFNIAVNDPILFEEAFRIYVRVLRKAGRAYAKVRMLAHLSLALQSVPRALTWLTRILGDKAFFRIWHPGFDLNYSSSKLQGTSFAPRWTNFEDVLSLSIERRPAVVGYGTRAS